MMLFFPKFYEKTIKDRYARKLATGITIASLECYAITPMMRLKNYEMTRADKIENPWGGYRSFLLKSPHGGQSIFSELYRGFNAVLLK